MGCGDSQEAPVVRFERTKIEPTEPKADYEHAVTEDERAAQAEFGYSDEVIRYRRRMLRFYSRHNPAKMEEVDFLLHRYPNREEEVLAAMVHKYGPEPEDGTADESVGHEKHGGHRPAPRKGLAGTAEDEAPEEPQMSEMPRQEQGGKETRGGLDAGGGLKYQELSALYSAPSFSVAAKDESPDVHV